MKIIEKKTQMLALLISLLFLITQINHLVLAEDDKNDIQLKSSSTKKWTYMLYQSFDTGGFEEDQEQMVEAMKSVGSDEELNIVILSDTNFPEDKTRLLYVMKNSVVDLSWYEEDSNMGDKDTLVRFVKRVKGDFPAENYALVLANPRGMAWQGLCKDDSAKSSASLFNYQIIDMVELVAALREITNNGRDKIDLMGFCMCITGSLEVAYQISPYVNYMVASEENMQSFRSNPKYTWPHCKSVSALKNNTNMTAEEFAICIVENFVPGRNTSANITCSPTKIKTNIPVDTTLSAVNLSRINEVGIAVDNLSSNLIEYISDYREVIKNARSEARKFGPWYSGTIFGYFVYLPILRKTMAKFGISYFMDVWIDLYHFSELLCKKLNTDDSQSKKIEQACHEVMDAMNSSIVANNVIPEDNAHGLHIYFPPTGNKHNQHLWGFVIKREASYENLDFSRATSWNEFLYKCYRIPDDLVNIWLNLKFGIL